ncbi:MULTISPECIES: TetR-like C-terminal domain-containing protein [Amycolatopsis]|uniref:DNA-binding transcriptional regulator, AcrR family n=2 Tax=Amycolatopsis TaxID=1813 RepID=A0A1I3X5N3_9PSEU|nr:TetR/AcrR family transcriptional regulator [Amycolatopsis sacchari]SFK14913.1 DNA-binding transcriptional regulator, AcrR family [Amycolatopsis sacchari]
MSETGARRGRGRRPAEEVRTRVLAATATLLFDEGLRSVTFDRVAHASGSSKTTLYKWWPSPGALAAEAYFASSVQTLEFHDTGDVRHDIRTQLRAFVRLLTDSRAGTVIAELIGAAQTDPELARALSTTYTLPRRRLAIDCIELARERGQLRHDVDADLLVDQLWGACYNRLLIPDNPLNEAYADALVDNTLRGAASETYRQELDGHGA